MPIVKPLYVLISIMLTRSPIVKSLTRRLPNQIGDYFEKRLYLNIVDVTEEYSIGTLGIHILGLGASF